jgi:hypothetical protein
LNEKVVDVEVKPHLDPKHRELYLPSTNTLRNNSSPLSVHHSLFTPNTNSDFLSPR